MSEPMSRRRFIVKLAVTSGALLLAPSAARADDQKLAWVSAGPAAKIPTGGFTSVEANGERAFVTRAADGKTFLALYARCTHRGCNVDFRDKEAMFVCPCHGGHFDGKGAAVRGPVRRPLMTLETNVDKNGILWVNLPVTAPVID